MIPWTVEVGTVEVVADAGPLADTMQKVPNIGRIRWVVGEWVRIAVGD